MELSVVVPVFNARRYLRTALDSLVGQTVEHGRMEIVCVDDGSTDDSPEILAEYERRCQEKAGHILRVVTLPENAGYGRAMNAGIAAACGAYVGCLEPDDYAEPKMFESLLAKAREHDADIVKSNYYEHADSFEDDLFVEVLQGHDYDTATSADVDKTLVLLQPCIWSAIYRRSFLAHHDIRFNETPGASYQDTAFAFKVQCCAKRVVLVPDAFVHYRIDNPESSIHASGKEFAIYEEIAAIDAFVNADAKRREAFAALAAYRSAWLHQWNIARIKNPGAKAACNMLMSGWMQKAHAEGLIEESLFTGREMAALIRLLHYRPTA